MSAYNYKKSSSLAAFLADPEDLGDFTFLPAIAFEPETMSLSPTLPAALAPGLVGRTLKVGALRSATGDTGAAAPPPPPPSLRLPKAGFTCVITGASGTGAAEDLAADPELDRAADPELAAG